MLTENWHLLLFGSLLAVIFTNAGLASCSSWFYRKKPWGRLTHNQLLIRQGKATIEQRLNVFAQYLLFSFLSFRIYLIAILLWFTLQGMLFLPTLLHQ